MTRFLKTTLVVASLLVPATAFSQSLPNIGDRIKINSVSDVQVRDTKIVKSLFGTFLHVLVDHTARTASLDLEDCNASNQCWVVIAKM